MFTMMEFFSEGAPKVESLKGKKFAFFGDTACNMAYSLALAGSMFGVEVVLCGPKEFAPDPILDKLFDEAKLGKNYRFTSDPEDAAKNANVIYTDVWVSMGKEEEKASRLKTLAPYQVNEKLFKLADKIRFLCTVCRRTRAKRFPRACCAGNVALFSIRRKTACTCKRPL